MTINKTKSSLMNSVTSLLFTFINGLCNLIVVRKLIVVYGSDFNGLNSTAAQFISVLLIIEGGFAVAANVALFKPLSSGDTTKVNGIISAINIKFHRIACFFLFAGTVFSVFFAILVKSEYEFYIKLGVFIFLVISTWLNLFYSTKYKILFQSDQKEYLLNILSIIFLLLSNVILYITITFECSPLILRAVVMLFAIFNSLCIGVICKKRYPYVNVKVEPDYESIKGTTDVFVQRIVGVMYLSTPIIFISVFVSTTDASIYAVYNTVITLIKSLDAAVINAPRMSLGHLIAENDIESERVKKVFDEYEFTTAFSTCLLLSTTAVMIMPFIRIYSVDFSDASYENWIIAALLIVTCLVECLHIPSGIFITMSGHFREGKIIQIIAGVVLVVSLIIGVTLLGITGIVAAVFFTAIILALMEIFYVKRNLLKGKIRKYLKTLVVNVITGVTLIFVGLSVNISVNSLFEFFVITAGVFAVNAIVMYGINYLFCRELAGSIMNRFLSIIKLMRRRAVSK